MIQARESGAERRVDVMFESHGVRCAAWLYRPPGALRAPVVVMGHGFGAVRHFLLPAFAERFVAAGLAVFVFDYRHFDVYSGAPFEQAVEIETRFLAQHLAA